MEQVNFRETIMPTDDENDENDKSFVPENLLEQLSAAEEFRDGAQREKESAKDAR